MKRLISLLLVLTLCVGMLPAPAWAEEEPTEPTQAVEELDPTEPSEEPEPTTEPTEEETTEPTEEPSEEPSTEPSEEETTETTEEETEPSEVQTLEEPVFEIEAYATNSAENVAMLEAGGKTTYYASLNAAIDAATAAGTGTVTLLTDADLENSSEYDYFNHTNKRTDLTIVLDGHTLTGEIQDGSWYARLTIDGTKPGSTFSGYLLFNGRENVLTINGGTYRNETGEETLFFGGTDTQLNITEGDFQSRFVYHCDSEQNVTGGTFSGGITCELGDTLTLCRKAPYCFMEDGQKVRLSELGKTTDKTLTVEKCTDHTYDENQLDCVYCGQRNPTQAPKGTVATVDGQFYSDLLSAIQAAGAEVPVVMFADCLLPDGFGLQLEGYRVTIDLNGKNLSVYPGSPIQVLSGDVTLTNSQTTGGIAVDSGNNGNAIQVQGGSLTVKENVRLQGRRYGDRIYPAIQVTGGTVILHCGATLVNGIQAPAGHTIAEYLAEGNAYSAGGQVINGYVQGTTDTLEVVEHSSHVFLSTGSCACGLTCTHSTISDETGLCQECGSQVYEANVTAADGSVTGYRTLEEALRNGTDATVKLLADCVVKGTEEAFYVTVPLTLDLNGKRMEGRSGLIVQKGPTTILDNSPAKTGTIAGTEDQDYSGVGLWVFNNANVTLTILGGHFEGKTDGLQVVGQNTLILKGGSFSSINFIEGATATLWDALAPGYAYYKDADDTLYDPGDNQKVTVGLHVGAHTEHTLDSSGHCPCGYTAVAMLDTEAGKQYFTDFPAAVTAAQSAPGSTVTLLQDVTLDHNTNIRMESGNFTIDWNGHTLRGGYRNYLLVIAKKANVTLKDSVGTGGVRSMGSGAVGIYMDSNGSLTILGGTYSPHVWKGRTAYGRVQISGGVFESFSGSGRTCALYCETGVLADLLAPGYTLAYQVNDALFDVYRANMSEVYRTVYVVEHPTHELNDDTDTCVCGFHCDHTDIDADGKCNVCGNQMAASVTAEDGSVTCYRNIADAIAAAMASPDMVGHCDTTVTLLDDIDETISNDGMDFVLDLNGKTLAGLELSDYHFALMDSQQTGTIDRLYSEYNVYTYLKEGWCLVDADGMSLDLLTRLDTSGPIQVVYAGVADVERSTKGTVSYGQQKLPFSLRFRLEDGLEASSVKVSWTYESAVDKPIGSVQTLTKDEDGFYTFDASKPLEEDPLDYGRLGTDLTHVLLSQIELELEDGQTRSIVLSGYNITSKKANLSDAEVTLDSTPLTYTPDPQTAVGREQAKTVTSVTLYGNTLVEGTDYEVTGNVGTDAGTYILTVSAKADSKFYTGSKTVTWEIKPLPIERMTFSGQNKLYDGTANVNPLRCEYLTTKDSQLIYGIQAGADYNVVSVSDYNSPDVHDSDRLAVTVELSGNYVGPDGTNRMELTVIGQIISAEAPAQGNVTVTVTNGNVATYTVENLDIALSDLTAPCTYGTITYGTPTVEIKDKSYAMTAETDGKTLKLHVTGTGEAVGQAAVVIVPVRSQNYGDFRLTVYVNAKNKIVPQIKDVGTSEIVYGQKLEESKVISSQVCEPDSQTSIPGTLRWKDPETVLKAGTHTMEMIFTPEDTGKYAETSVWVAVQVNKRPVTLSGVTIKDKTYDGTKDAEVDSKGTFSGVVSGDTMDTMDYTVTAAFTDKNVAKSSFTTVTSKPVILTVTLNGDTAKNYTLAEDSQKETTATITPKEVDVTGGFTAQDRDYEPQRDIVIITKGTVTFVGKLDGDDLDAEASMGTADTSNAGQNKRVSYLIVLDGTDKNNYTVGSKPELTVTIRPIAQTLAFADATVTKTYGDASFANALTHSAGDGAITYTSGNPAVATVAADGTVTIQGAGTARITATAGATQNYVETSTSFDLTVARAVGTVKNSDYDLTYFYGYIREPKASDFTADSTGEFHFDWTQDGKPVEPRDAGTYTLTVTVDGDENFNPASLVLTVTVNKTSNIGKAVDSFQGETIFGKNDGLVKLFAPAENCEYRVKGETDYRDIPGDPKGRTLSLDVGTYEFRLKETKNYNPTPAETVTIQPGRKLTVTLPEPQTGYTLTADKAELSWHDSLKLTLTVAEGYYKTASFALKAGDRVLTEDNGTYTLTNVEDDVIITLEGVEKDEKGPWLDMRYFSDFGVPLYVWGKIDTSTVPLYIPHGQFMIQAVDEETHVTNLYWMVSKDSLTTEELDKAVWEPIQNNPAYSTATHPTVPFGEWYVYVKAVDGSGNVSYLGTQKLVREENPPTFDVKDGATYYTTQKVTITDDYVLSRYLAPGSKNWENISGTTYDVTLEGNREATYTMKVEDACQNTSTLTVYMRPISALTEDIQNLTADNVRKSDRDKLTRAENALEGLNITNATDEEKGIITKALRNIAKLEAVLDEVDRVEAMIAALPDSVEPWDAEAEKNVKAARAAYDGLTDHQKSMVDDSKLTKLEGQLVDYRFTSGENQSWSLGSGKDLTFCANGQLAKVKEVRLNGQAVDVQKAAQAKGTEFTLRALDLQVLGVGSYTLQVIFTDGQTPQTQVTVTVSPNYLDLTPYPDFAFDPTVTIDGRTYPTSTDGGFYVNLPETGDYLQRFDYQDFDYSSSHGNYPTGMTTYRIHRQKGGATLERIDALDNLLIYAGCSIRISGKQGIRMITGITQENKKALTSKAGLAGYTLEEYGTLICWNTDVSSGDDFSLDMSCARSNYAYKKGKVDPVFGKENGNMLYTNVLVGFSLEDCAKDLVLRPYIKLKDTATGETVTLYGGSVCRSIGYIARQNADTYKSGSSGYKYVHNILKATGQEP